VVAPKSDEQLAAERVAAERVARERAEQQRVRAAEREREEQERAAIVAAISKDRARRMRRHAAGNFVLACFFLACVAAVAAVTKGRALVILRLVAG
jgi:hypothetical protein